MQNNNSNANTIINTSQINHMNANFHKIKESTIKKNPKDSLAINNKPISKNISDVAFKIPKRKLILANNSSLGD